MKKLTLGVLVTLAIGINTAIWLSLKNHPGISAENGPMENFQVVCLAASFFLWLIAACKTGNHAQRIFLFSLTLFTLSFLVHEIDLRKLGIPALHIIFHGTIRNIWLGALWLLAGWFFLKNTRAVWQEFLLWIKSPSGVPMIISGLFWIASGLNDKSLVGQKNLYFEEMMEVNSTLLMLLSAIFFLSRKPALNAEPKSQP